MILYFSGTGNTYAVAKTVADKTGDKLLDMGKAYPDACSPWAHPTASAERHATWQAHVAQSRIMGREG